MCLSFTETGRAARPCARLLVIGHGPLPGVIPAAARVDTLGFAALTAEVLRLYRPDLVVCPLFHPGHDAVAVIERLQDLAYPGAILVLSPALPRPDLVEQELRALGPLRRLRLVCAAPAAD